MKMSQFIVISMFLAACAAPQVEQSANGFDEDKYQADLNDCRGGSLLEASTVTFANAAVGSLWGAFHGAPAGAMAGDGWEGAAIGAVVGATIGLGAGAKEAMDKHDAELIGCLRGKGYMLVSAS
jgi:outer membrane lipoprotein SlyB